MCFINEGYILVSPHQFPDLNREKELAKQFGLELFEAKDQASFRDAMPEATIIMVTPYGKVYKDEIDLAKKCKAIVRYGMGYDNIDVIAANNANIPVSIVPDASSEEVATHAFAMGLALSRRIPHGQEAIKKGEWAGVCAYDTPKLSSLNVGILGMGRIGRLTAGWWKSIGANVKAYDPFAKFDNIEKATVDELIANSDVLSLHLPLNEDTENFINSNVLSLMKKTSVIVNVSRGGLIDEIALSDALKNGVIAGAALDVFSKEPLPLDNVLRDTPNIILTPHIAWRSNESLGALQAGAVDRARQALAGEEIKDRVYK